MLKLLDEAVAAGARLRKACQLVNLSVRTVERWRVDSEGDGRAGPLTPPPHKLTEAEREAILEVANSAEFRDKSPRQIVPTLADRGVYIASESTFYRVLHDEGLMHYRERAESLSRALGNALPELPRTVLDDVAEAMNQLDVFRDELSQIERVRTAVSDFGQRYRAYAQIQARRQARAVPVARRPSSTIRVRPSTKRARSSSGQRPRSVGARQRGKCWTNDCAATGRHSTSSARILRCRTRGGSRTSKTRRESVYARTRAPCLPPSEPTRRSGASRANGSAERPS